MHDVEVLIENDCKLVIEAILAVLGNLGSVEDFKCFSLSVSWVGRGANDAI